MNDRNETRSPEVKINETRREPKKVNILQICGETRLFAFLFSNFSDFAWGDPVGILGGSQIGFSLLALCCLLKKFLLQSFVPTNSEHDFDEL